MGGDGWRLSFFLEKEGTQAFTIKALTEQTGTVIEGVQAVGGLSHIGFDEIPKHCHTLASMLPWLLLKPVSLILI